MEMRRLGWHWEEVQNRWLKFPLTDANTQLKSNTDFTNRQMAKGFEGSEAELWKWICWKAPRSRPTIFVCVPASQRNIPEFSRTTIQRDLQVQQVQDIIEVGTDKTHIVVFRQDKERRSTSP